MSYVIELDREEARQSFALHSKAELEGIRLAQSTLSALPRTEVSADLPFSFKVDFGPDSYSLNANDLYVVTQFDFKVVSNEQPQRELMIVLCKFEARYNLHDGYAPPEEAIAAFRKGNAVFNCWPFFREYAQNAIVRMGYPPPPIGFLRLAPKPEPNAATTAEHTATKPGKKRKKALSSGADEK